MEPTPTLQDKPLYGIMSAAPVDQGHLNLNFEIELNQDEYNALTTALSPVLRLGLRDMYRLVERNYRQLDRLVDFYVQLFGKVGHERGVTPRQAADGVTEAAINWLNATRLFLDHETIWLKRHYGEDSPELTEFDRARTTAFDTSFAYRFLYKLRDYTTHCGLPLSAVSLRRPTPAEAAGGLKQRIVFALNRDDLLSRFDKWGRHVTPDLQAMPPTFELLPLIHDVMPQFDVIMEAIIRNDIREAAEAAKIFKPYLERIVDFDGAPCLFRLAPDWQATPTPIPVDTLVRLNKVDLNGDVLAPFRHEPNEDELSQARNLSPHYRQRIGRGVNVLTTWLRENGGTDRFYQVVDSLVKQDGNAEPMVTGLVLVSANALMMAASAMGTQPGAILGFLSANGD